MTYKNIRIKKKGGGYRTQRVQVLKSGKYKFVKNKKTSTKSSKKRKGNPHNKKRRNKMSKRMPLSAGVSALVAVTAADPYSGRNVIDNINSGAYVEAAGSALYNYTGIGLTHQAPVPGQIGGGAFTFDIQALNPFCFTAAPALKAFFWTKIITKVTRKFLGNPLTRIPFINEYVSWS